MKKQSQNKPNSADPVELTNLKRKYPEKQPGSRLCGRSGIKTLQAKNQRKEEQKMNIPGQSRENQRVQSCLHIPIVT